MKKQTTGRIVYPRSIQDKLALAGKVFKKHQADGPDSELNGMDGYSWDATGPDVDAAIALHKEAEALKAQMEEKYRQRDLKAAPVLDITKASGQFLKGKYRKNPKKLGDWGYTIDDTPPVKKVKKSA